MWMGGNPPLGYDVKDKKLIVNEAEAETVRSIFRQYRVIESDGERALATLLAGPDVVSIKRLRQDAQPAKHPIILAIPIALKRAGTA